jgi:hypothetical protein
MREMLAQLAAWTRGEAPVLSVGALLRYQPDGLYSLPDVRLGFLGGEHLARMPLGRAGRPRSQAATLRGVQEPCTSTRRLVLLGHPTPT